ncbi:MAG TPA: N-acetylmuramidase family protein [Pyrinomonadaceae bacterium]|jgi:hypothetical protein
MSNEKLILSDFETGANEMRCEPEAIMAVFSVESNGSGFLPSGKLKILFERHKFYKYADKQKRDEWARKHPNICNKKSGGYFGGEDEYKRFNFAFSLDKHAALMSCSIGAGQTMGFNYALLGFRTVDEMWDYARTRERAQLDLFLRYCRETGLADELRRHDWAGFARGYNGEGYKRNKYDAKMAAAYKKAKASKIDWDKIDSAATFKMISVAKYATAEHPALTASDFAVSTALPVVIAESGEFDDPAESDDAGPQTTNQAANSGAVVTIPASQPVESFAPKAIDALNGSYAWLLKVSGAGTGGTILSLLIAKLSGFSVNPKLLAGIIVAVMAIIVLAVVIGGIGALCYIVGRFVLTNKRERRAHEINMAQMRYVAEQQFTGVVLKQ